MTGKVEVRVLAVPILEESPWTPAQGARFTAETRAASLLRKADQGSEKCPGSKPEFTPQLNPNPHA